jgi:RNA polymerase sigma-70 factor (ECF subfamily)
VDGKDHRAAGQLFQQHGALVYRRALRLLGSRADAEEATQEVFVRVMRGLDRFEGRSQMTTWLYHITTNHCLNLIRDRARRQELLDEHAAQEAEAPPDSPPEWLALRRLLATADELQARAAVYVFVDGMSHEEAAELLSVSRRTVGNLLDRFVAWARRQPGLVDPAERKKEPA